jgi:hypothetical protein
MFIRLHPRQHGRLRALTRGLLLASSVLLASAVAAKCPPDCVSIYSVVHAAGEDPKIRAKLTALATQVRVDGTRLAGSSAATVKSLAAEINAMPKGDVVTLQVHADTGLAAAAAQTQAKARSQALQRELTAAGVQTGRVKINAATN